MAIAAGGGDGSRNSTGNGENGVGITMYGPNINLVRSVSTCTAAAVLGDVGV